MVIENKYLRKAIEKTKYIVLVKRYIIDMPGSSLVYVSPNASEIGMNVEMLNKRNEIVRGLYLSVGS